jgi:hypothetical protein
MFHFWTHFTFTWRVKCSTFSAFNTFDRRITYFLCLEGLLGDTPPQGTTLTPVFRRSINSGRWIERHLSWELSLISLLAKPQRTLYLWEVKEEIWVTVSPRLCDFKFFSSTDLGLTYLAYIEDSLSRAMYILVDSLIGCCCVLSAC